MNPLTERLEDLRAQRKEILLRAHGIVDQPKLTRSDVNTFDQCLDLVEEIQDLIARLERQGEKWRLIRRSK